MYAGKMRRPRFVKYRRIEGIGRSANSAETKGKNSKKPEMAKNRVSP